MRKVIHTNYLLLVGASTLIFLGFIDNMAIMSIACYLDFCIYYFLCTYISKLQLKFIEDRLDISKKELLFKDRQNEFSPRLWPNL